MMTQLTTINANPPQASSDLFGRFSSISSRLTDRLKETGVPSNLTANFDNLIGGIKNFLPQNRDLTMYVPRVSANVAHLLHIVQSR